MERFLDDEFVEVKPKNPSEEALRRWRNLCGLEKNPKRRFRFTANLSTRHELVALRRANQEKLRIAVAISKVAFQFIIGAVSHDVREEVKSAGFEICAHKVGSIVEGRNKERLIYHGGVEGIVNKLSTSTTNGISTAEHLVNKRKEIYGVNKFPERPSKGFLVFLWEAFQDVTLMILGVCAIAFVAIGIMMDGWPKGAHGGLGILASILFVVLITSSSDYRQSLQFNVLGKRKIDVQVTRDGYRQKLSIYDLLVGDIVHLAIGDQVPADGLFISGYYTVIDESNLTGESEPIHVDTKHPFLLSGSKVQDGSLTMLVTTVGMRTQWYKLMTRLSEEGDDETPLQVKLNGVATVIGKIGLFLTVITSAVIFQGLYSRKLQDNGSLWSLAGDEALEILDYFADVIASAAVAIPEGLPLAVTLSLAFAVKKMINHNVLVCHRGSCETMAFATSICTNKTGTLTTNNMTVVKAHICGKTLEASCFNKEPEIPDYAQNVLVESIFNNTEGEFVKTKDNKIEIFGSPIETAILKFGLLLGGDFTSVRKASRIVELVPFNSSRKKMGVILEIPSGGLRAHCKGASEIILAACNKVIDSNGNVVSLDKASVEHLKTVIDGFASSSLRTLCLAYKDLDRFSAHSPIPVDGYTCIGIVGINDPIRQGVKESVAICRSAGITVRMITGDNINTAKAIARECGILTEDGIAIEGPEFLQKSDEEFIEIIPKLQVMARSTPMDKLYLVKRLGKNLQDVVAVTGYKADDAHAFHEAEIGIAMGIAGTEVAKQSADLIISDDNFSTIVTTARWGRTVYNNIQRSVQFQLTVTIVDILSACLTVSAPLTVVQLLWVNLITDTLGALALSTEQPTDEIMKRQPVRRKASIISKAMWRNILGQVSYQLLVLQFLRVRGKSAFGLSDSGSDLTLNTIIFNSLVFCQIFNMINSREMEKINVFSGILNNYMLMGVVTSTTVFQIVMVQFLGIYANTTPLSLSQWSGSILFGFIGMPVAAALKMISI